jgi:hypothetical protein
MSDFPAYQSAPQYQGIQPSHTPSLRGRSVLAIIALVIATLAGAGNAVVPMLPRAHQFIGITTGASIALYLVAGVFFILWLHRARTNLESFGVHNLRWSPGWTIGAWFVPVASLVMPILVISEIDKETAARTAATADEAWGGRDSGRPVFILWAVFWTLRAVGSYGAIALLSVSVTASSVLRLVLELAAGTLAVLLVLRITDSQEQLRGSAPIPAAPASPAFDQVPVRAAWPDSNL